MPFQLKSLLHTINVVGVLQNGCFCSLLDVEQPTFPYNVVRMDTCLQGGGIEQL